MADAAARDHVRDAFFHRRWRCGALPVRAPFSLPAFSQVAIVSQLVSQRGIPGRALCTAPPAVRSAWFLFCLWSCAGRLWDCSPGRCRAINPIFSFRTQWGSEDVPHPWRPRPGCLIFASWQARQQNHGVPTELPEPAVSTAYPRDRDSRSTRNRRPVPLARKGRPDRGVRLELFGYRRRPPRRMGLLAREVTLRASGPSLRFIQTDAPAIPVFDAWVWGENRTWFQPWCAPPPTPWRKFAARPIDVCRTAPRRGKCTRSRVAD